MRTLAIAQDQPPLMPAEFQPAIEAILSEIDFAHEHELEKVEKSAMDDSFKMRLVGKLNQLHQERRRPYAYELLLLENRTRSISRRSSRS